MNLERFNLNLIFSHLNKIAKGISLKKDNYQISKREKEKQEHKKEIHKKEEIVEIKEELEKTAEVYNNAQNFPFNNYSENQEILKKMKNILILDMLFL